MHALRPVTLAVLAAIMAGCAAAPPAPPPPPAIVMVDPPHPVRPVPAPVLRVAYLYQRVAQREVRAVTSPHVTAEYVHQVHAADLEARRALTALEHARPAPTMAGVKAAQAAVARLDAVLTAIPRDGP